MNVLELKKEIDDYIEAGGDKYCNVVIDDHNYPEPRTVCEVTYAKPSEDNMLRGGSLVLR